MKWLFALLAVACTTQTTRLLDTPTTRGPLRHPGPHSPRIASYRIEATLDAEKKRISAHQFITWKNNGIGPVDSLMLHLFMNAFKNEESVFLTESRIDLDDRVPKTWGWIEVTSVALDGEELPTELGIDETTLEVFLSEPVLPGATLELSFEFEVQLPDVLARTGFKGDFIMVAEWFPKLGVLEVTGNEQAWHCEPFHYNSEFYADFGTYDVSLVVSEKLVVAATGVLTSVQPVKTGERRLTYHAEDVHDFAWMADPHMRVKQAWADGDVELLVYYRPEQERFASRHLGAASRAIETLGKHFGPYPWSRLTIIDPPRDARGAMGMEYPTLVATGGDSLLAAESVRLPELVTIHEVTHNWFQGIIASNEVDEAWLDEGLTEFATGLVLEEWLGQGAPWQEFLGLRFEYFADLQASWANIALDAPVTTRSYEFPTGVDYAEASYRKVALALRTLAAEVGREHLLAALGDYARSYAFRHPSGIDFFGSMERSLGKRGGQFLEETFRGMGRLDFRIRSVASWQAHAPQGVFGAGPERKSVSETKPEGWISQVLVANEGGVVAPVDLEVRFQDGSVHHELWDGQGRWRRFSFERPSPIESAILDPEHKLLLESEVFKNSRRESSSSYAAWRAAVTIGFWEQTLLEIVGL